MAINYKNIYLDILERNYPDKEKKQICNEIFQKKELNFLDIIRLNELIFGNQKKEVNKNNQSYRAYNEHTIIEILKYQKKEQLGNSQIARMLKMSRNTIAKWKKIYHNHPAFLKERIFKTIEVINRGEQRENNKLKEFLSKKYS